MNFAERVNRAAAVIEPWGYERIKDGPPPEDCKMALVGGQLEYDEAMRRFREAQHKAAIILTAACPDLIFKTPEAA